jgi:hypothetical protein
MAQRAYAMEFFMRVHNLCPTKINIMSKANAASA